MDTWTGDWRVGASYLRARLRAGHQPAREAESRHDRLARRAAQVATDPIPWDREFPGTRHYSVGYLSYNGCRRSWTIPKQTQVLIDSLEPRWFYGIKSFSETSIGAVSWRAVQTLSTTLRRPHARSSNHARQNLHRRAEGTGKTGNASKDPVHRMTIEAVLF